MAVRIESNAEPIPGYKLIQRLGGGGFGDVWKVEAPGGLFKAIKFVYGDLQDASEDTHRAEQELKALSRVKTVRHPYILSLERFDIIDGQLLIVMELADRNLWDRFKECRAKGLPGIPRTELLGFMEETAEALDLMNIEYQLQHLDIKPQNIFLIYNHVKVADFGLVKDLEGMAASVTGGVTPVYAAPETFDGWVSRFSDQYSLAIVYQELLTGQRPFSGTNVRQLIMQHLQATPNLASLPPEDRPIIARSLSKKPDDRYPTCSELVQAIKAAGQGKIPERPQPPAESAGETPAPTRYAEPVSAGLSGIPTADLRGFPNPSAPTKFGPPGADIGHAPAAILSSSNPGSRVDLTPLPSLLGPAAVPARAEVQGDGVLFPAIVLGLGHTGLNVLASLKEMIAEKYGAAEEISTLKLLYIDTDPDMHKAAAHATPSRSLAAGQILLARLNRPSHYIKARDGRAQVDSWIDPQMLYRIPRSQITTGLRALGRLAFCDNILAFNKRVRDDLAAVIDPEAMPAAARQTQLTLRTTRPRIYLVAGLGGGSGGGMFLDAAYVVRSLLREMGFVNPDVQALLLLPTAATKGPRPLAMANAHAALKELNFFSSGKPFSARYHEREPAIQENTPPFTRCLMLELPEEKDDKGTTAITDLAGSFLFRDLFTPLGRASEEPTHNQGNVRSAIFHTFGMYRLASSERRLLHEAARLMCRRMVDRWMTKDAGPIEESVREWVGGHWNREEFGAEALIEKLQLACQGALNQPPEDAFAAKVAPILSRRNQELDLDAVEKALQQFQEWMGRPDEESLTSRPIALDEALKKASEDTVNCWGQKLTELIVQLIELPGYRLAGAEEAARQIIASLDQTLKSYETLANELDKRSQEAFYRVYAILDGLDKKIIGRKSLPAAIAELLELLGQYPKWRYQFLIMRQVNKAFISLRGNLSDELREINFCRNRLGELYNALAAGPAEAKQQPSKHTPAFGHIKQIFADGCQSLEDALQAFISRYDESHQLQLEKRIQQMIRRQFQALVQICMSSENLVKDLESAMLQEAEAFMALSPAENNVAEVFFTQNSTDDQALGEIQAAFDEAVPEMTLEDPSPPLELCVLSTPPGPLGARFVELSKQALSEVPLVGITGSDEIVFYRQYSNLSLADLPHLAAAGQEAYRQMSSVDHLTPHARIDITFGS